jgi:hypothetical protein
MYCETDGNGVHIGQHYPLQIATLRLIFTLFWPMPEANWLTFIG